MSSKYKTLLSPIRIGNVVLKNRLISTNASPHFLQGPETYPADPLMTYVRNIAKGGASMIMFGEWANPFQRQIGPDDSRRMQNFDLSDPSVENYLCQLAEDVHFYDAKLCVSLMHSMPEGYIFSPVGEPPDDLHLRPGEMYHGAIMHFGPEMKDPQVLPAERMHEAMDPIVKKLQHYKTLGYDMAALDSRPIISSYNNLRTDEYGGCFANRARFLVELCERIKKEVGQDFLILIFGDAYKGGYTPEDAADFARMLDGKADFLMFRKGDATTFNTTPESYKDILRYTRAVTESGSRVLSIANTALTEPDLTETILAEGQADLIGMGRGFICETDYVRKIRENRPEDILPCLLCNKCHGLMKPPWLSFCSINPVMGLEHKIDRMVTPVEKVKKVAVIGGGPAGMESAIFCARRGHEVTLYEKHSSLGGQLRHGDYASFKWPIRRFKEHLILQLDKLGVRVILGCSATPELISASGYDVVISALGSVPKLPPFRGVETVPYLFCPDVFGHEQELGKRVAVLGGSETGVETAMYLAECGHDVTILTRQPEIAHDASKLHSITMDCMTPVPGGEIISPAWVRYPNLNYVVNAETRELSPGIVRYSVNGKGETLDCDSFVICGGMSDQLDAALAYADTADEFYMVGDCQGAGNIQKCVRAAYAVASRI